MTLTSPTHPSPPASNQPHFGVPQPHLLNNYPGDVEHAYAVLRPRVVDGHPVPGSIGTGQHSIDAAVDVEVGLGLGAVPLQEDGGPFRVPGQRVIHGISRGHA